ncbi:hypothetical protein [Bradyrhizobium manausense]|uniref:Uncharacterized protein n=1 Tax=Bradyrhizobium manausense TaxID=989370 RepID=A0A0R3DJY2_9BRAD|nr:hypothetical protein [Bradyrhizobium manausense]KRQ10168.1 hypothetical protein AOQ71_19555 [Bradyrhizobium manausense]
MLRRIISAIGRLVAWAADKGVEIMLMPVHAVLMYLFPAAYETLPIGTEDDRAANSEMLPFDPFERAEEVIAAREIEANLALAWAAEAALSDAEVPLPSVKPELRSWLASLSDDELDALVAAGTEALYAHLHFEMHIPGVPTTSGRASRPELGGRDPCFSTAGFGVAAQRCA